LALKVATAFFAITQFLLI